MFGPEGLLVDGQRATHQRLGLCQTVGVLEQHGQVVQADGDGRVFGTEGLLADGQRATHQRLGLCQTVGGLEQLS